MPLRTKQLPLSVKKKKKKIWRVAQNCKHGKLKMEESEAAAPKETTENESVRGSDENKTNEATGEVSIQMSNQEPARRPPEETEARYNRLKLFEKVMQKSLEKFIEHVW